jgi:hypothetical protein
LTALDQNVLFSSFQALAQAIWRRLTAHVQINLMSSCEESRVERLTTKIKPDSFQKL